LYKARVFIPGKTFKYSLMFVRPEPTRVKRILDASGAGAGGGSWPYPNSLD